jgi:hypothetical protein
MKVFNMHHMRYNERKLSGQKNTIDFEVKTVLSKLLVKQQVLALVFISPKTI